MIPAGRPFLLAFESMDDFHQLLRGAVEAQASDVHLKQGAQPAVRIAGSLHRIEAPAPDALRMRAIVEAILPAHLRDTWKPENEADFSYFAPGIGRFRTSVFLQRGQLSLAMRLVKTRVPSFEELGLPEGILRELASAQSGLMLISGKMGSGKSTTLAACIESINETFPRHIVTLEDPIEYFFEDKQAFIEQREIGLDTTSFEAALRHVTRQDPDVIVIGEMRDAVSFLAAVNAAETGHLVLGTLHSNTTRQAVDRILDFFPRAEREQVRRQLAAIVRGILCQRLVRAKAGGLVPAVEILRATETVRKLIENDKLDQLGTAIQTGGQVGMVSFNQSLLKLVQDGVITEEEALGKSTSPEQLRMNFRGVFTSQTGLIT